MNPTNPIGIFDSGLGGLTVVRAVHNLLPNENIIYLGDTARVPYGNKSKETVERYSLEISSFLADQGVKMIIVACNSASSLGIESIREKINLPVLGVIGPGARTAVKATKNKKVGVIGTKGTISSGAYQKSLLDCDSEIKTAALPTPLFVPLVEEGWSDSEITKQIAEIYLEELLQKDVDTLILGCTHYPFLKPVLSIVMGKNVELVDSAEALASEAKELLINKNLGNHETKKAKMQFYSTDSPRSFIEIGERLTNLNLKNTKQIIF